MLPPHLPCFIEHLSWPRMEAINLPRADTDAEQGTVVPHSWKVEIHNLELQLQSWEASPTHDQVSKAEICFCSL